MPSATILRLWITFGRKDAKSFQKPEAVRDTRDPRLTALEALSTMAPGGGAGALGTEAPVLLGTRSAPRPTAHEAYQIAKTIVG